MIVNLLLLIALSSSAQSWIKQRNPPPDNDSTFYWPHYYEAYTIWEPIRKPDYITPAPVSKICSLCGKDHSLYPHLNNTGAGILYNNGAGVLKPKPKPKPKEDSIIFDKVTGYISVSYSGVNPVSASVFFRFGTCPQTYPITLESKQQIIKTATLFNYCIINPGSFVIYSFSEARANGFKRFYDIITE